MLAEARTDTLDSCACAPLIALLYVPSSPLRSGLAWSLREGHEGSLAVTSWGLRRELVGLGAGCPPLS